MFETPCLLQWIIILILHATKRMIWNDLWQSQGVPEVLILWMEIVLNRILNPLIKN